MKEFVNSTVTPVSLLCIMVPVCCMYSLHCKLDLPVVRFYVLDNDFTVSKTFFPFSLFSVCCGQSRCRCRKGFRIKVGHLSQNYITILIRINNWPESYLTKHGRQIIPITFCNFSSWLSVHMLLILIISLNRKIILSTF